MLTNEIQALIALSQTPYPYPNPHLQTPSPNPLVRNPFFQSPKFALLLDESNPSLDGNGVQTGPVAATWDHALVTPPEVTIVVASTGVLQGVALVTADKERRGETTGHLVASEGEREGAVELKSGPLAVGDAADVCKVTVGWVDLDEVAGVGDVELGSLGPGGDKGDGAAGA